LRAGLICILLVVLLLGCQSRPHVFRPPDRDRGLAALDGVADKLGVFVAGIDQAPPPLDAAVREGLATRLGELDIAASAGAANRHSYLLSCVLTGSTAEPVLAWRLIDAEGMVVGLVDQALPGDVAAWVRADPTLAERIVDGAAPRLAAIIRDNAAPDVPPPPPVVPSLSLLPVSGAPGDGATALAIALQAVLRGAGIPVVPQGEGDFAVSGTVTVKPGEGGDLISLSWTVLDGEGTSLGVIDQANRILSGSLDGAWGETAEAIAYGAAEGILAVLADTVRKP
jgi:hypothetical protein